MSAEFLKAFERINRVSRQLRHVRPLPPTVTTITFAGRLDSTCVPVEDMRTAALLAEGLGQALEFVVDDPPPRAGAGSGGFASASRRFKHQLPLKRRGKSVKVFHNGSVHATGCTSPLEFLETMAALVEFVRDTGAGAVRLVDFHVHLVNALFVMTCPSSGRPLVVPPGALMDALEVAPVALEAAPQAAPKAAPQAAPQAAPKADPEAAPQAAPQAAPKAVSYGPPEFDAERHPSVKIPVHEGGAKKATACVFQTGSVSIMGARGAAHVALAFEVACRAVDSAAAACVPDRERVLRKTTAKHALYLDDGYPFNLKACCMW